MEENQGKNDVIDTYTTKRVDGILIDFVTWANKGITQGITVSVKGTIYTGTLIGGAEWCDLMIEKARKSTGAEDFISALTTYYEDIKSTSYSTEEQKETSIHFLHLKNAHILTSNNLSDHAANWRFDIGEIDGFSVGSFTKK